VSLDEKLFYYLWKSKKKLLDKKRPIHALDFADIEGRLTILSNLLSETTLKLKKAKFLGGLVGDTLFITPTVYFSEDLEVNELVYLHQVCLQCRLKI